MFLRITPRSACFCLLFFAISIADAAPVAIAEDFKPEIVVAFPEAPAPGLNSPNSEGESTANTGRASTGVHRETVQASFAHPPANTLKASSRQAVAATTSDKIIRIMPLGDSNTEGGSSAAYRDRLEELLDGTKLKGLYDFVGSQSTGGNLLNDTDHAGFGGARDEDIYNLLMRGEFNYYGSETDVRGPGGGPYLDQYSPDIILLHIGTNWVDGSAGAMNDVKNILDQVDLYESQYGKEVTVIVAKIIKRICNENDCISPTEAANTPIYNDNLEKYINERIAAGDNLSLVDMEEGAGITYTRTEAGGDMADDLHPNASGYAKMAQVWFDAIMTTNVVLPVELIEFKASYSQMEVQLHWSTAMEQENSHFVVERMQEGQPFTAVGTVAGAGNSSSLLRYTYIDANAPAGQLYYRLKQVDEDGTYSYSNVIAVNRAVAAAFSIKIYPNPTEAAASVYISATGFAQGCPVDITLSDAMGRKLYHQTVKAGTQGEVTTEVQLPDALVKGMYIWELRGAGRSQQLKLLVR